ncbi:GNAT family N-acetyltransferase [Fontibacillus sp. BL9]|uniref:GNAT family N-acetyltransferase n=1 Tax=Fontibacillus sp. BL9 TaxID=3389971 RepID=UPI00397DB4C2
MAALLFEEINDSHLEMIRDIYNYYVLNTTISFHTESLTHDQIRESVIHKNKRFKSFVIREDSEIIGYVLITQYKNKQAYDICAEVTIYLAPGNTGKGAGKVALNFIEKEAKEQGFHTLIATICMDNLRSKALFERNGYKQCAFFKEIGFKFNERLDIGSFQKIL